MRLIWSVIDPQSLNICSVFQGTCMDWNSRRLMWPLDNGPTGNKEKRIQQPNLVYHSGETDLSIEWLCWFCVNITLFMHLWKYLRQTDSSWTMAYSARCQRLTFIDAKSSLNTSRTKKTNKKTGGDNKPSNPSFSFFQICVDCWSYLYMQSLC